DEVSLPPGQDTSRIGRAFDDLRLASVANRLKSGGQLKRLASMGHVHSSCQQSGGYRVVSRISRNIKTCSGNDDFGIVSDDLKRLVSLVGHFKISFPFKSHLSLVRIKDNGIGQ